MKGKADEVFRVTSVFNFDRVSTPEDLKPKGYININPPPADGKCECCGRPMRELTPYGGPGDPLVGDFTGALLIKKYRPCGPYNEEAEKARDEAEVSFKNDGYEDPLGWMKSKHGKEKGERLFFLAEGHGCVGKSWECRDCSILDNDEYFEKLFEMRQQS